MKRFYHVRIIFMMMTLVHSAIASTEALETARSTVKEWAATEKVISLEVTEWNGRKHLLDDLIEVAAQRIRRLEADLAAGEDRLSAGDEARATLLDQRDAVAVEAEQIEAFLVRMESRMHNLKPKLPEPLLEELATVYQRLPDASGETSLGLGERMRTVVSLLSRIREFDEVLTLAESLRTLPGSEEAASVRTLYLGLGQAYFIGPEGAGYGWPGPEGWVWHSAPELREAVREAIVLAEGAAMAPKFVDLPVRLDPTEGGAQ
jgi:predicted  nucleic acid-binding Zn-ribbon protein